MRFSLIPRWSMALSFFLLISVSANAASHVIGNIVVTPNPVIANVAMPFTVTAQITDPLVIPTSVNLLVYDLSGNATIASRLYDDGTNGDVTAGDGIYTAVADLTIPAGAELAVSAAFRGVLKRVISTPIPIASLTLPPAFNVNMRSVGAGGPLALDNFNGAYSEGGIIPSGGAAIDVTTVPLPPSVTDFIKKELSDSNVTAMTPISVSGITCTEASYSDSFSAAVVIDSVATYCPSGNQLFKFYLSYNSGDPNTNQFLSSYQQVLTNAKLTP